MTPEQIIFTSPLRTTVTLLVNPETLTLAWKKVINRVRTKTRMVTLMWGEEPVKFTYTGQTGYCFPSATERANHKVTLIPNKTIEESLKSEKNNTQILHMSEKYKVLKSLEKMYEEYQDPTKGYITLTYRNYIFQGYFEGFSFTDDAKNPWNWIYNIDFTILQWEKNPDITVDGELMLNDTNRTLQQDTSAV